MSTAAELMDLANARAIKKSEVVSGVECQYWFYPATTTLSSKAKNIVLVHGYRGDHHGLESFAGGLSDFNIYAPDLPGFGVSSPLKKEHNLENYVQWLQGFISELGLKKPVSIGHSFGTLITSALEAREKTFSAMIFINPVAGGKVQGLSRFLMYLVKGYYWIAHVIPNQIGLRMVKTYLLVDSMSSYTTKSNDKALRRWIKMQHRQHFNSFANSQVVWESYIASIDNTMSPYIKGIHVPALLIAAELDEVTPVRAVIEMSKTMDDAVMFEVSNCGHLVHYEAASVAIEQMQKFIVGLPN
jgi:pimeloyl-ACP methyl ester carboxylesterase